MPRLLTAFQKKAQEEKEKLEKAAAMEAEKDKAAKKKKGAATEAAAQDNQAAIDDQSAKENAVTNKAPVTPGKTATVKAATKKNAEAAENKKAKKAAAAEEEAAKQGTGERKRKKNDGEDRTGEAHKKPKAKTTHREDDSEFDNESGSGNDEDHILDVNEYAKSEEDSNKVSDEEEDKVSDGFVSSNGGDPELSDEEEEEDETNNFKVTEYIKNDQKEFPLVAYAVEGKISIGLLPLSFFVHQNENFLFCQPQVNHRNVSLVDVRDILSHAALEDKARGKGFEEEMMVVVYEVTSTEEESMSTVPIYATYQTEDSEDASPSLIRQCYAKYPTKAGIRQLLQSLNMTDLLDSDTHNDITDESNEYLTKQLLSKIFNSDLFQEMNVTNKDFFSGATDSKKLTKDDTSFPLTYRRLKNVFQSEHNIRFAFMGGNHRMATAVHLFGGYKVEPNSVLPPHPEVNDYGISSNMKITASPNITVKIPKDKILSEAFIMQCNICSYVIEKRKTESIMVTYNSLSKDILDENKHPEIENKNRFLLKNVFLDDTVMTQIQNWRLEITCQEASLLVTNAPTKEIAIEYCKKINKNMKQEKDQLEFLEQRIRTITATSALHLGIRHGTEETSSNIKFPEPLLSILWMHRWAIADAETLQNFRRLLRTDIMFVIPQKTRFDFYTPEWLRNNIINNVVKTIKILVDENKHLHKNHYNSMRKISTRLKAALMHHLTTEIISALLWCGPNPLIGKDENSKFITQQKQNLDDIDDQLRLNHSAIKDKDNDKSKTGFLPTTYTEAILASIPNIIEVNIANPITGDLYKNILKNHPNQGDTQSTWVQGTTWKDFKVFIPITTTATDATSGENNTTASSTVRQPDCLVMKYFQMVLKGNIPAKLLFLQPPTTTSKNKKKKEKASPAKKVNIEEAQKLVAGIRGNIEGIDSQHTRDLLSDKIDKLCDICNITPAADEEKKKGRGKK